MLLVLKGFDQESSLHRLLTEIVEKKILEPFRFYHMILKMLILNYVFFINIFD